MHNLIQELRGNVRVFARVRPFLPGDKKHMRGNNENRLMLSLVTNREICGSQQMWCDLGESGVDGDPPEPWLKVHPNGEGIEVLQQMSCDGKRAGNRTSAPDVSHSFKYDRSFHPSHGQETVFEEVSEFVQSALDGYNVCLFSYGQTGSGKTHTMQGVGSGAMRGIIPRAVEQVARYKTELSEQGWKFTMHVSFIEIYCEKLRDLLGDFQGKSKKGAPPPEHKIIRNEQGANTVSNVAMISVDPSDVSLLSRLMEVAARSRATTKTDMNDTSSRSHSVFTLHLAAVNRKLGAVSHGQLNLCDLAGSERVSRSGVTGTALTEAKNINKSLSSLAHVFESLSKVRRNNICTYIQQAQITIYSDHTASRKISIIMTLIIYICQNYARFDDICQFSLF